MLTSTGFVNCGREAAVVHMRTFCARFTGFFTTTQLTEYTVKKVSNFPVPSRDVTNQTLHDRE